MQPPKYGELLADQAIQEALEQSIETDIDFWVESKQREPDVMYGIEACNCDARPRVETDFN